MPFQLQDGKLLIKRTKPVSAADCCCCPKLEGVRFQLQSDPLHQCDCARFDLYVNDVRIGLVNFNNAATNGVITVNHTLTKSQADAITATLQSSEPITNNCCLLLVRLECLSFMGDQYGCNNYTFCHQNISYMTVFAADGHMAYAGSVDVVEVTVDICGTSDSFFYCNYGACFPAANGAPYAFPSLYDCEINCQAKYQCSQYSGCYYIGVNVSYGYTKAECEAICLPNYVCNLNDQYSSDVCTIQGYGADVTSKAECEAICVAQSYDCLPTGCFAYTDTSGALTDCTTCIQRYTCDPTYSCMQAGFGTSGYLSYEECAPECTVKSYTCSGWDGCLPRYDNSGELENCDDCQIRYVCYSSFYDGTNYSYCNPVGYATSGLTLMECCSSGDCATSVNCGGGFGMAAMETPPEETPVLNMQAAPISGITIDENANSIETWGSPQERENMRRLGFTSIAQMGAPPPVSAIDPLVMSDPTGPGTFLSKMLEKIGIKASPNCSCKARAYKMNEMGADWCEQNLDLIVGWLREEATKRKLPFVDFAGKLLVKRAIKLSRAARSKAEQQCDAPDTPPLDSDSQAGAG